MQLSYPYILSVLLIILASDACAEEQTSPKSHEVDAKWIGGGIGGGFLGGAFGGNFLSLGAGFGVGGNLIGGGGLGFGGFGGILGNTWANNFIQPNVFGFGFFPPTLNNVFFKEVDSHAQARRSIEFERSDSHSDLQRRGDVTYQCKNEHQQATFLKSDCMKAAEKLATSKGREMQCGTCKVSLNGHSRQLAAVPNQAAHFAQATEQILKACSTPQSLTKSQAEADHKFVEKAAGAIVLSKGASDVKCM